MIIFNSPHLFSANAQIGTSNPLSVSSLKFLISGERNSRWLPSGNFKIAMQTGPCIEDLHIIINR